MEYRAFAECGNLTAVTIPDSVTKTERSTFRMCDRLVITAPKNSCGAKYARSNKIKLKKI